MRRGEWGKRNVNKCLQIVVCGTDKFMARLWNEDDGETVRMPRPVTLTAASSTLKIGAHTDSVKESAHANEQCAKYTFVIEHTLEV